jgi:hypothetical protein
MAGDNALLAKKAGYRFAQGILLHPANLRRYI